MDTELVTDKEKMKAKMVMEMKSVINNHPVVSEYITSNMQGHSQRKSDRQIKKGKEIVGFEFDIVSIRDDFLPKVWSDKERVGNALHMAAKMIPHINPEPSVGIFKTKEVKRKIKRYEDNNKFMEKMFEWNRTNNPDLTKDNNSFSKRSTGIFGHFFGLAIAGNRIPVNETVRFVAEVGKTILSALESGLSAKEIIDTLDEKQEVAKFFNVPEEEVVNMALADKLDLIELLGLFAKRDFEPLVPCIGASINVLPQKKR